MTKLARFTEFSRKIVAVGRNYSEHAAELGNAVPTKPLLFMKVLPTYFNCDWNLNIIATKCYHNSWSADRDTFGLYRDSSRDRAWGYYQQTV